MKRITSIEVQKNNQDRVSIFLDNKFAFGLDMTLYLKYNLKKDMELEEDFIETILKAEEINKSLNYAISLLSRKDRTKREIEDKLLNKGYDIEVVGKVLDKLKEYNYINDEIYCEKYINDKIKFTKYGKNKIKANLYAKGVDKDIISRKIIEIDNNFEYDRALELARKKLPSLQKYDKFKIKAKLGNYLISKGFDYDVVNKVINNVIREIRI